ncbi:MAG: hypothetical protein Q8918_01835 [Bacteroidota bacterium]|nr:hypothetical protein [Bacteroidota bacterium]MDP4248830.1 hypothetical protein [Bacteroidota bacterium]
MNTGHPSEKEIQQYALDKSDCPMELAEHISSCESCSAGVDGYQLLFSGIKQQSKPSFDFDLTVIVLRQLPSPQSRLSADRFIACFLFIFVGCCIGIPLFLFRQYLLNIFTGISPFFIYAIIVSTAIISSIKILNMYKKYQQQMNLLNFN